MTLHKTRIARPLRSAFTLLEILVVVAIIVALAGLGAFYLIPQSEKADEDLMYARIKEIEKAIDTYKIHYRVYPDSLQDLLVQGEKGGPYLEDQSKLISVWQTPFQYDPDATSAQGLQKPKIFVLTQQGKTISNYDVR